MRGRLLGRFPSAAARPYALCAGRAEPVPRGKEHPTMKPRTHPDRPGTGSWRQDLRQLPGLRAFCGWTLLLLMLGWGSASPARALSGTIDYPMGGNFLVGP